MDGSNASARVGLGMAGYLAQPSEEIGQATATALGHFEKALELDPKHVGARLSMALCEFASNKFGEAEQHLKAAELLTTDPVLKLKIKEDLITVQKLIDADK